MTGTGSGISLLDHFSARETSAAPGPVPAWGQKGSFLSVRLAPLPGLLPDTFAVEVIEAHTRQEMKGKLVAVTRQYRGR